MNESKKDQKTYENGGKFIVIVRWIIWVLAVMIYFFASGKTGSRSAFLQTAAIAAVYNIFASYFILRAKKVKRINFYYFDILLITVFTFLSGGVDSEVFILYIFAVGSIGIFHPLSNLIKMGFLILALYAVASIKFSSYNGIDLNYWKLIIREVMVVVTVCGAMIINRKIKKFDELHKKEFKLARTDKLTGLANRHYFEQKLKEEMEYADKYDKPLNILIFDLDNFKKFNDTYGHVWGDKLLSLFSDIIMQNIRKSDIPVRFGGEEFLILIRDLELDMAKCVGDRIRRQLEKQRIYVGGDDGKQKMTVSCGVAQYPKDGCSIKDVIENADKALYHAKKTGKNAIVLFEEMNEYRLKTNIN